MTDDKRTAWLRGIRDYCDAALEGRPCQWRADGRELWEDERCESRTQSFLGTYQYRAKPKARCRPFTPSEAAKHIGREVGSEASRELGNCHVIVAVGDNRVWYRDGICGCNRAGFDTFDDLLKHYRFTDDGSPCGVLLAEWE